MRDYLVIVLALIVFGVGNARGSSVLRFRFRSTAGDVLLLRQMSPRHVLQFELVHGMLNVRLGGTEDWLLPTEQPLDDDRTHTVRLSIRNRADRSLRLKVDDKIFWRQLSTETVPEIMFGNDTKVVIGGRRDSWNTKDGDSDLAINGSVCVAVMQAAAGTEYLGVVSYRDNDGFYCHRRKFGLFDFSEAAARRRRHGHQHERRHEKMRLLSDQPTAMNDVVYTADELLVEEGGSAVLDTNYLYVFPQYERYNLQPSQVLFELLTRPRHGKLTLGSDTLWHDTFTYADVLSGRLQYTHDGSETAHDVIEVAVSVEVADGADSTAPPSLPFMVSDGDDQREEQGEGAARSRRAYSLPVRVRPVNDAPEFKLPNGGLVRMAYSGRLPLDQSIMFVRDWDDAPDAVRIRVKNSTGAPVHFELDRPQHTSPARQNDATDQLHRALDSFTLSDLNAGHVRLVHDGADSRQLAAVQLYADDGRAQSRTHTLTVHAYPIAIRQVHNTGVRLVYNSHVRITAANLSFAASLSEYGPDNIVYTVVSQPEFGFLELNSAATEDRQDRHQDNWWLVQTFTQRAIDEDRLRYKHSKGGKPTTDRFRFIVSAVADNASLSSGATATPPIMHEFKISFIPVTIKLYNRNSQFILNNTLQATITDDHLFAWIFPRSPNPDEIHYVLTSAPKYGFLYRLIDPVAGRNRRLGQYANFTQQHVDDGHIFYKLHFMHYTMTVDRFNFKIVTPAAVSDELHLDITFLPADGGVKVVNRTLVVTEGRLHKITNATLSVRTGDDTQFSYGVARAPEHGVVHVGTEAGAGLRPVSVGDTFVTQDILDGKVFYRHDDSESSSDRLQLVARPVGSHSQLGPGSVAIPVWLTVKVVLINDHVPKQVSDGNFYVVERSEKVLTADALLFTDADLGTKADDIVYTFENNPHAHIFKVSNPQVEMHRFTQSDVNNGRLVLRHTGGKMEVFEMPFSVSDGVKTTESVLFVNATAPFLRQRTNTGLILPPGSMAHIFRRNLSVETNMNVPASSIRYEVLNSNHIWLLNGPDSAGTPVATFTQEEVNTNRVIYVDNTAQLSETEQRHDEVIQLRAMTDQLQTWINFKVMVRSADEIFRIHVEHVQQVDVVLNGLTVLGAHAFNSSRRGHMDGHIRYNVTSPPQHGTLMLQNVATDPSTSSVLQTAAVTSYNVKHFTQFDVNQGTIYYQHGGEGTDVDTMQFEVTAGDQSAGPYELKLRPVENKITITTRNVTVSSGERAAITIENIRASSSRRAALRVDNERGAAERAQLFVYEIVEPPRHGLIVDERGQQLTRFTTADVFSSTVFYVHDRSSTWMDSVLVVASPQPAGPQATDRDTPSRLVKYLTQNLTGGYVAYSGAPSKPIESFSQLDIDEARVLFVRFPNSTHSGFTFVLSDGRHRSAVLTFRVNSLEGARVSLEANHRLVLAPGTKSTIGMEMLRAHVSGVAADKILYNVTRGPKHGRLLVKGTVLDGVNARTFTQHDVNLRQLQYENAKTEQISQVSTGVPPTRNTENWGSPGSENDDASDSDGAHQNWVVRDSFHFEVSAVPSDDKSVDDLYGASSGVANSNGNTALMATEQSRFRIIVTYAEIEGNVLAHLVPQSPALVPWSGSIALNGTHFNVTQLENAAGTVGFYTLVVEGLSIGVRRVPQYGVLYHRGKKIGVSNIAEAVLSQSELNDCHLVYKHIPSMSLATAVSGPIGDTFVLEVFPKASTISRSKKIFRLPVSVMVQVMPKASNQFDVSRLPDSLHLVRGTSRKLNKTEFNVSKEVTRPRDVLYTVAQGPTGGHIALRSTDSDRQIQTFTQEQIDQGLVYFVQLYPEDKSRQSWLPLQGKDSTQAARGLGSVTLSVQDASTGGHDVQPISKVISVQIEPLTLTLVNLTKLTYKQGTHYALITSRHLGADSNGPADQITYNITKPPENGTFWWVATDRPASSFTQTDVDSGLVVYNQLNVEAWRDSATLTISNRFNVLAGNVLHVSVTPAAEVKQGSVRPGATLVITQQLIDASEVRNKSPTFLVVRSPVYGRLIKLPEKASKGKRSANIDSSGSNTNSSAEPVTVFSFDDILAERIVYVNALARAHTALEDSFMFELRVVGMQPARAIFRILVHATSSPSPGMDINQTIKHDMGPPIGSVPWIPRITESNMLLVYSLLAIAFVAAVLIVMRRWKVARTRERRYVKAKQQQDLLAQQEALAAHPMMPSPAPDLLGTTVYAGATLRRTPTLPHRSPSRQARLARTLDHTTDGLGHQNEHTDGGMCYDTDPYALDEPPRLYSFTQGDNCNLAASIYGDLVAAASPKHNTSGTLNATSRPPSYILTSGRVVLPATSPTGSVSPPARYTPPAPATSLVHGGVYTQMPAVGSPPQFHSRQLHEQPRAATAGTCTSASVDSCQQPAAPAIQPYDPNAAFRYAYQYSSSASDTDMKVERLSLDCATGQRIQQGTHGNRPKRTPTKKLNDSQYWV